ncbi:MAG: hypothetical protein ACI97B_002066 [Verrucomicrobiales bacterium]|jgi:hypothetical protein
MDWNKLNKEQQQQLVLIVLVVITSLYALISFGLKPMSANWGKYTKEVKDLSGKVRNAEVLTKDAAKIQQKTIAGNKELAKLNRDFMAEESFAWASRQTYEIGRELGLDLEITQSGGTKRSSGGVGQIAPYSIDVHTKCSYDELMALVVKIQDISPYTTIANLIVASSKSDFESHDVTLKVQWPIFKDPQVEAEIKKPPNSSKDPK